MKLSYLLSSVAVLGLVSFGNVVIPSANPHGAAASAQEMKDATGLNLQQKIALLMKTKGQLGNGDILRRSFFGHLEPIAIRPGGAGMVVLLYNPESNYTYAYCTSFDTVVAMKQGKTVAFTSSELK